MRLRVYRTVLVVNNSPGFPIKKKKEKQGQREGAKGGSSTKRTHRDNGGTRRAGKVLDDLPIGLLDGGVRRFRRVGGVRLRGRRCGLGSWRIEQQLDTRLAAVIAVHVLPETGPSPGAPGSWDPGYRPGSDFTLAEQKETARVTRMTKCVSDTVSIKPIFLVKCTLS